MATASVTTKLRRTTGVSFDLDGIGTIEPALRRLMDERIPWFQERAMRTLARRLPVEARRDIQAEYNIKAGRVRDHMRSYVMPGETSARLAGVRLVGQWKRGIGLAQFSGRWKRNWKGVRYSVYRGAKAEAVGAFIARMKSGNVHAVQRVGPKDHKRTYADRKGVSRTRIDQRLKVRYRSSVAQMLAKGRRPERLMDYSKRLLQSDLERQIGSYLRKPSRIT